MKKSKFSLILILGLLSSGWAKAPGNLTYPELKFVPPAVEKIIFKNGMTLFLLADHELPLINCSAILRAGSMHDQPGQAGLAGLAANLLRGGGTESRTREAIDEALETLGASVETGMDVESGSASFSCLRKDLQSTLEIFADVLRHPAFNAEKLEIEKAREIEGIRRRNDEPYQIARRQFRRTIYGPSHPLSRTSEIAEIKKISRDDLIRFYQTFYMPQNLMLTVSGDFVPAEMARAVEQAFDGWENRSAVSPKVETVPETAVPGTRKVIYAEKDLNQTSVIIGHLGIRRHNPDRFALEVMNEILGGGGFASRLTREVRERLGLAYWVGSNFSEPYDYGVMACGAQTKSQSAGQTIKSILAETERMAKEAVSQEELKLAKDSIVNSFVFRYNSAHAIAVQTMTLEYLGFPKDYLETYTQKIAAVTAGDVLAAAKKYLHADKMSIVVVGNKKDFDFKLEELGPVIPADLKITE